MADVVIIGAGPAGISAALTVHARGRSVQLISNEPLESPLSKAGRIDNYPGLPKVSGTDMLQTLMDQAADLDIQITRQRVVSVLPFGDRFMVSIGSDMADAGAVILALGVGSGKAFPGEMELLGRGVSYCATCDGMLYRGKHVCVVGNTPEAESEAGFLQSIGCQVTYVSRAKASSLADGIETRLYSRLEVEGTDHATALVVHGRGTADDDVERLACDAVFVLRPAIAPGNLVPGLETEGAFITVDDQMRTNIPGIFAAGDCTGKPLQVAKAVGQGQLAAFSAVEYVEKAGAEA